MHLKISHKLLVILVLSRNFPTGFLHGKKPKFNFKRPGPDGSGGYRAVIMHGPPGIGKTTTAHLVAKLQGFDVLENNASDTRSKSLLSEKLRLPLKILR